MKIHSEALRRKIDEFGASLPPGSCVAVMADEPEVVEGNIVALGYTLRPVFPGQPAPAPPWVVYAPPRETSIGYVSTTSDDWAK